MMPKRTVVPKVPTFHLLLIIANCLHYAHYINRCSKHTFL